MTMVIQERDAGCSGAPDLRQRAHEGLREFEARAFVRLTKTPSSEAPRTILICCNDRQDQEALAGRTTLCRAALALLFRAGGGEVVLVTRPGSSSHSQLAALADSLTAMLVGSNLRVSARFSVRGPHQADHEASGSQRVA